MALRYWLSVQVDTAETHFPLTTFYPLAKQLVQSPFASHLSHLSSTLSQVQVTLLKKVLPVHVNGVLPHDPLLFNVKLAEHFVHLVKSL